MNRLVWFCTLIFLSSFFFTSSAVSQTRDFGANRILVDDDADHIIRIVTPAGLTDPIIDWVLPIPPVDGMPSGFVGVGDAVNTYLIWNDGLGYWEPGPEVFIFPYSQTGSVPSNLFSLSNTGTGRTIFAQRAGGSGIALGAAEAIRGDNTNGPGVAGTSNTIAGVYGTSTGSDGVWGVSVTSATGGVRGRNDVAGGYGVWGQSSGSGIGVYGESFTGRAGLFEITNGANGNVALEARTAGINRAILGIRDGGSGIVLGQAEGVRGDNTDGPGVAGTSNTSVGVYGTSSTSNGIWGVGQVTGFAGVLGRNDVAGGYGVHGESAGSGIGVYGTSNTGRPGLFDITNGANGNVALEARTAGINRAILGIRDGGSGIVLGQAEGVRGDNTDGPGVAGTSNTGVGVYGTSSDASGVWGVAVDAGMSGVLGRNDVAGGYGVTGQSMGAGIGVHGESQTGRAGFFEITNGASTASALYATTAGTGWAGEFINSNASPSGVRISTAANQGGTALNIANGTIALSNQNVYVSGSTVDDAILVVTGSVTIPTAGVSNGTTVWVVNNSGGAININNTTLGALNVTNLMAQQLLFVSAVDAANWIPVQ